MPEAILNGARIYYQEHGRGFPLVLAHGLGGDHAMWLAQVPLFKTKYRVVLWDCRGHGRSEVTEEGYSIGRFVDDQWALLQYLGIQRAHIGGLSMGGWIAWSFAIAHPEAAASLVLSDSAGIQTGMSEAQREQTKKLFEASAAIAEKKGRQPLLENTLALMFSAKFLQEKPEIVALVRKQILADPGLGYARTIRGLFANWDQSAAEGVLAGLARISVPALILAGDLDVLTPLPTQQALQRAIPNSRLEVIPGAGHVPCIEQPELWNRLVLDFLAGVQL
jgi:3-oxoadipate enol-lactonase